MGRPVQTIFRHTDFSGGLQTSTTRLMRKPNELSAITNGSLAPYVGGVTRRLGQQLFWTVQSGKDGGGSFVHRYSSGSRLYAATNNSGDTATVLQYWNGVSGTVLSGTSYSAGTKLSAVNYLDELYVVGYSPTTDTFQTTANIDSTPNYSTTRNVQFAPKAKQIDEFQGRLYASNVEVNINGTPTRYPDRTYLSSFPMGAITFVQTDQQGALTSLKVDTVRYLKVGMVIDIYKVGTETARATNLTITGVVKDANNYSIQFAAPSNLSFATTDVNTSTDVITLSSTANFPTGTPIVFSSSNTVPAGLVAGTIYYAINVTGTTIKVATTAANAGLGTAVDITSQGTGTHNISVAYIFTDNDEIWGAGRKGKLSVYWNTDFPTTETADFLRIPAGQDENSAITANAKMSNRKFIFTSNTYSKWDGANLVNMSTTVGCPAPEAVKQVGTWLIFPHYTGIWAYNENSGQLKLISRGISDWIAAIPIANFASMSAGTVKNQYKLSIGFIASYKGQALNKYVRLTYDFDMNNWVVETHTRNFRYQYQFTINNSLTPVFQDQVGNIIIDNIGNTDLNDALEATAIPMEFDTGRNHFGWDEEKAYTHVYVYCTTAGRQGEVMYRVNGGVWTPLGQLQKGVNKFTFPHGKARGRDIDYRAVQSDVGDPILVEAYSTHYSIIEATYS